MFLPDHIKEKLNERKAADAFRSLSIHSEGIDFYSNDYLGIARLSSEHSQPEGSTGSRLISGNSKAAEELEAYAATYFNYPSALLFNSGYSANIGLLSTLPQRGDTIIYDELVHASLRDGIQLSNAHAIKFKHNNLEHLQERLSTAKGNKYVLVESVYSMDGDCPDFEQLQKIVSSHQAFLIVDEAHGAGVFGKNGRGLIDGFDSATNQFSAFAKVVTFGKAYGSHGAMILCHPDLRDYLINFCRPFIYTTALPPSNIERIKFALDVVGEADESRSELKNRIDFFQTLAAKKRINILKSNSPIQAIIIPSNSAAREKAKHLNSLGFIVKPILSPTVPKGKERIRICLHSYNTQQEIEALINAL